MPAIPAHNTAVVDVPWDAGRNVGGIPNDAGGEVLRRMFAFVKAGADPDLKGSYSLPHHEVSDGRPGAANVNGCRNAMGRMMQMRPPLSARDQAGVRSHLQNHIDAFNRANSYEPGDPGFVTLEAYDQLEAGDASPPRDNLVRSLSTHVELRSSALASDLGILYGTLVPYDEWAEIRSTYEGHFMERFAAGSFGKNIRERGDHLQVLYEHGLDPSIGRKVLGPIISLDEHAHGVDYEVRLLDTQYNRELLPAIKEGLLGSSVRFRVIKEDFVRKPRASEANPLGLPERTVREAGMAEFGPCPFPTYDGARAGVRSITDDWLQQRLSSHESRGIFIPERIDALGMVVTYDDDFSAQSVAALEDDAELRAFASELSDDELRSDVHAYERIVRYVLDTPWMITESSMGVIAHVLAERLAGARPSEDEIAQRIGARAPEEMLSELQSGYVNRDGVAVIPIMGPIVPHGSVLTQSSGMTSVDAISEGLRNALASDDVKAVMLHLDTPGGSSELIPELGAQIREARAVKPIVAMANTWAASAGYWLASQADEIVATPSGEVGSIGVITAHQDMSEQLKQRGVKITTISAGKYKGERQPHAPLSKEARAELQRKVDKLYDRFVATVAEGRGVDEQTVREGFGQGRMIDADEALEVGMIDRIATFDETLAELTARVREPGAGTESHSDAGAGTESHSSSNDGAGTESHSEAPKSADDNSISQKELITMEHTSLRTLEELGRRQDEIRVRLQEIQNEYPAGVLPPELQNEWDSLVDERDNVNKPAIAASKTRLQQVAEYAKDSERRVDAVTRADRSFDGFSVNVRHSNLPDNPYALEDYRNRAASLDELPKMYRDGALRIIELSTFPHPRARHEDVQTHLDRLLSIDSKDAEIARRIIGTASPSYDKAYGKALMGRPLTADEQRQLASFSGGETGGYAVPFTLDPTLILTTDGSINPLRQIARIITIAGAGNTWKGTTTAGVVASYQPELTEATDDKPTLGQPELTVEKAQAFVPFSIEIDQDWPTMRSELATLFQEAKDELEAEKFLLGTGTDEPEGVLVGSTYNISTGSAHALTVPDDMTRLAAALGPRFRSRATWVANLYFYNLIRAGDTNGTLYATLTEGRPGTLMGQAAYEASYMDDDITVDGAALAIYGDFTKFAIVDKIGLQTELIPHVFGTVRNFPTGERGIYAYWRNTSGVLVDNAFRVLTAKS